MAERVMTRGEKHRRSRTAALGDRVRHGGRGIGRRACNRNCRCVSASAYLWSNYNAGGNPPRIDWHQCERIESKTSDAWGRSFRHL